MEKMRGRGLSGEQGKRARENGQCWNLFFRNSKEKQANRIGRKRETAFRSCPQFEGVVPASCAEGMSVRRDCEATDTVLVRFECLNLGALEDVPHDDFFVVIPGKEEAATDGKVDGGHTFPNHVVSVLFEFSISADVKESARGVIRASSKCKAVGEELHCVDVRFVSSECLNTLPASNVPEFGVGIAGPRNECVLVW